MNVILLKNIKYQGFPYRAGEHINIAKDDLSEFVEKKIINEEILKVTQEINRGEEVRDDTNIIDIDDISKADIVAILVEKGIEHNNKDKKEVLFDLMLGSE